MSTFTPITEAELDRWIIELNSGEHKQVNGQLRDTLTEWSGEAGDYEEAGVGYCCLGLKCEIDGFDLDGVWRVWEDYRGVTQSLTYAEHGGLDEADENGPAYEGDRGPLPTPLRGLSYRTRSALASANDGGHTFAEIAAALNLYRADLLAGRDLEYRFGDIQPAGVAA